MVDTFKTLISELWAKLKLGSPRFDASSTVMLTVDGLHLTLDEAPDGRHLIVSGAAGRLAADPTTRSDQVRRLLKANLGFLQSNRAGLFLESTDDTATVRIQAVYPYAAGRIDQLTALIEDVLHRLEIHSGDLANQSAAATKQQVGHRAFTPVSHEEFIFRP
jgi:Tir chaperone protein (CesT) family